MQAKAKSNSVVTTKLRDDGVIEYTVLGAGPVGENGQPTNGVLTLDPKVCGVKVRERAIVHGLVARIVDRAALDRNKVNGAPASPVEKLAAMKTLVDWYATGTDEWAMARATSVAKPAGLDPLLLAACVEGTGRDEASLRAIIASGATKRGIDESAYLVILATAKAIAPIVARMQAEEAARAAAGFDADAELDAMLEGDEVEPEDPPVAP